ncbi:MAG: FAD:protein FMN transferase [Firmicutes bacterium]|nr:FAD:protein FMN transferase [Bacillota bacterium]
MIATFRGAAALPGVALYTFGAMNTEVRVLVAGSPDDADRAGRLVQTVFQAYEVNLSRFLPSSALTRLNRDGVLDHPPRLLVRALRRARTWQARLPGWFDPTVLPALERAGYDRSFETLRAAAEPAAPRGGGDAPPGGEDEDEDVDVDEHVTLSAGEWLLEAGPRRVRLAPGVRVDLGGIGKGLAVDDALKALARAGFADVLVNAGGDMRACGGPPGLDAWPAAVLHPLLPGRPLREVRLRDAALATSSTLRRRWVRQGEMRHHLIDPRTGRPAASPWVSVTAWAPDAETADAAAKAMLIAGPGGAARVAALLPEARFLCVRADGGVEEW